MLLVYVSMFGASGKGSNVFFFFFFSEGLSVEGLEFRVLGFRASVFLVCSAGSRRALPHEGVRKVTKAVFSRRASTKILVRCYTLP